MRLRSKPSTDPMAATTGDVPIENGDGADRGAETAPLLDGPLVDDTVQRKANVWGNLITGFALIAQLGVLSLAVLVVVAVAAHPPFLPLFSPHPLLQTAGLVFVVEALLVLQPTSGTSPAAKKQAARLHAILQFVSLALFAAGVGLIEANKIRSAGAHLKSLHGWLGALTTLLLAGQYVFGLVVWTAPRIVFGDDGHRIRKARALWKHHRWTGYVAAVPLLLATVVTATTTDYNVNVLGLKTWVVAGLSVLVAAGLYPQIQKVKLGL